MALLLDEPAVKHVPHYITVKDPPKLDLDSYIANYDGLARLNRLQCIGGSSPHIGLDALRLAINETKQSRNIEKYTELIAVAKSVAPADPLASQDQEWLDSRTRQVKAETDRLEHELKGYKNNLIKESIRMGNEELGAFYYNIGDYASAFKAYSRMREYCTTPKHLCEMTLKLILTAIAQENWMHFQSNIYKLNSITLKPADAEKVAPIVSPLRGLAALASSTYTEAAVAFLSTDAGFATLEPMSGINFARSVISPNDVAIYGALLSLATMSRIELQTRVLENATFRSFLELEPHLRRAIVDFVSGKYTACLSTLEAYRADYLLDLYLQRHVGAIYSLIRRKSMVAYFAPFSRVSIATMAKAFDTNEEVMTTELTDMIMAGSLQDARVDLVEMMLVERKTDKRLEVTQRALKAAEEKEKELRLKLWNVNMREYGLEIKAAKGEGGQSGGRGGGGGGGRGTGGGRKTPWGGRR